MRQEFSLIKRGKYWYYYTYVNEKRVKLSTGKKSKSEALSVVLEKLENKTLHKEQIKGSFNPKFKDFAAPFFILGKCPYLKAKDIAGKHYNLKDVKKARGRLENDMIPYFGELRLSQITPYKVREWLFDLPKKHNITPKTANAYLLNLRVIFKEAVFQNLITQNPALLVEQLAPNPKERQAFNLEQIRLMFSVEWDNDTVKTICMLSALTGMRLGEIIGLTKENLNNGYILVCQSYEQGYGLKSTKSGKSRIVTITDKLQKRLNKCAESSKNEFVFMNEKNIKKPYSYATINIHLSNIMDRLGIFGDYSFHSFRHFFNTYLVASGISGDMVRSVIGHSSVDMTDNYLHLQAEHLKPVLQAQNEII